MPRPSNPRARIVSYSELAAFRQCPLKWKLAYEQRWTRDLPEESARNRGTAWHVIMEEHYAEIMDAQREFTGPIPRSYQPILLRRCSARVAPLLSNPTTGEQTEQQALLEWMYEGYVQLWGADLQWEIVAIERNHYVPLPSLTDPSKPSPIYYLRATIDLVVRDRATGQMWIVDHKTGRNLPSKVELDINDQFGLYTWVAREVGFKVVGSLHSAARTQRNKGPMILGERFGRTSMFRSDTELTNLALDATRTAQAAWATKGKPVQSSPDPETCRYRCDFLDAHLMMRKGIRPSTALRDFGLYQAEFSHTERPDT